MLSRIYRRCNYIFTFFKQHLEDLKSVFEALRAANLSLKASKCHFCHREMKYLGNIITCNGIKPDSDLVKSVIDFLRPNKIKDVFLPSFFVLHK